MNDKYSNLNSTFNVEDSIEIEKKTVKSEVEVEVNVMSDEQKTSKQDIQKDYEYTRGNLYSIIEKGQEAINGVLELAQETEQPRAYEVVGQLIKSVSDATEKLMDLQKKLKDIESEDKSKGPTNVTNALFIGSTAELSKLLKAQSKGEDLF
jgi:hypothetical protein